MKYLGIDIPRIVHFYLKSKLRVLLYYAKYMAWNLPAMRRTRALRMSARGKNAFVFANGPSLGKLDPKKIAAYQRSGYDVVAINSYITSDFARVVIPDCYVLSDPASFGINYGGWSEDQIEQYRRDFATVTKTGARLFVPLEFFRVVPYKNTYAFCDAENLFSSNVRNILRPRGYVSQTAFKALSIASYLGYEKIYLCGLDNDYFKTIEVGIDNDITFADRHFYAENESFVKRSTQDLFGREIGIGEALYMFHFNFKHLERFSSLPIINLAKDSLVDAFTKHHDLDVYAESTRSYPE